MGKMPFTFGKSSDSDNFTGLGLESFRLKMNFRSPVRFIFFIIKLTVFFSCNSQAQTCDCEDHFEWVKKTFEENDAGFQYIIDKKGQMSYDIHNRLMMEKFKSAKTLPECAAFLNEWLKFFRSGHIGIQLLNNDTLTSQNVNILTPKPFLEELNASTLYLRIPSFRNEEKSAIDSVLSVNRNKILKTKNLIIDLRNNGGGGDASYWGLRQFLYTNPIQITGLEYLSTDHNNKRFLDFAANIDNEKSQQLYRERYEKLQNRLGEFVNLNEKTFSVIRLNKVFEYPKNVGIIINKGCASATESFLLEAKQSKKVKLFGTNTFGAMDISNMYFIDSPCKKLRLHYGLTKRLWLPEMTIDDIGLQPDFYFDKTVLPYKWVEEVIDILNK